MLVFVLSSCEQKKMLSVYYDMVTYAKEHKIRTTSSSRTGMVSGDAVFSFEPNSITVRYTALNDTAVETGDLEDLDLAFGSGVKNRDSDISLQGVWNSRVAGDGDLIITPDMNENALCVFIFGDGWQHQVIYYLDSLEDILNIMMPKRPKIIEGIEKLLSDSGGETTFYYPDARGNVFLEIVPDELALFKYRVFRYTERDGLIDSKMELRQPGTFPLTARGDKIILKYGGEYELQPAGDRLEKLTKIPDHLNWILGKWVNVSRDSDYIELFPDGRYEELSISGAYLDGYKVVDGNGEDITNGQYKVRSSGTYLIQRMGENKIPFLFIKDNGEAFNGEINMNESYEREDYNVLEIDRKVYIRFPSWLNGKWTNGEKSFSIDYNILHDPQEIILSHSSGDYWRRGRGSDWNVQIYPNSITLQAQSYRDVKARLFLDRENHSIAIADPKENVVIQYLYHVD